MENALTDVWPKKTAEVIINSGNDYLGALKGNQAGLLAAVEATFQAQQTVQQLDKGHGRIEKRTVSISHQLNGIPAFPGLVTLIRVEPERRVYRTNILEVSHETRYYIASFIDTAQAFADRIRGYWGVENKVHNVRDVTQGEDASRIRTSPLIQIWARHGTLPSICIGIRAFKIWLKPNVCWVQP